MAHDVFISYSSKEYDTANIVRTVLKNNGIDTWMAPESIPGGSNYMEVIPDAIANSKVFVLILSDSSQKSKWVPKEVEQALNNNLIIIPFLIENCKINSVFNFIIGTSQRINAFAQMQEALEELVNLVKVNVKQKGGDNTRKANKESSIDDKSLNYNVKPIKGSIVTEDGDFYEGFLINNKPHGKGKMEYTNGDFYDGFWRNGEKNGRGTMTYANGNIYSGEWKDNNLNGKGKLTLANGDVYEGNFKDNKKDGKGKYTWKNNDFYDGDWVLDKKTGKGEQKRNNYMYEGDFIDGKYEGIGTLSYDVYYKYKKSDGTEGGYIATAYTYKGDFKNGQFNGYGEIEYSYAGKEMLKDAENYQGDWKNGKKEGKGKVIYQTGSDLHYFEGTFVDGKRNGYGEEIKYDGKDEEYEEIFYKKGQWKDSKLVTGNLRIEYYIAGHYICELELKDSKIINYSRKGDYSSKEIAEIKYYGNTTELIWPNGEKYECEFQDGFPYGYVAFTLKRKKINGRIKYIGSTIVENATVVYANGDEFEGKYDLICDAPSSGRMTYNNCGYYEGEWYYDGRKVGKGYGKKVINNGYYEGEMFNGEEHGKGKFVWNDGDIYEGDWKEGKREGHGKYIWPNGDYYDGEFKNSKRHGKGKYKYASSGKIETGEWYEGKKL